MSSYGFIKVPRDIKKAIPNPKKPTSQKVVELPSGVLGKFILEYAQKELPEKVLNHSLRVYQYSVSILKDQFPEWDLDHEVLFVTALLHDIGTTDKNMSATNLSFEFYGGIISRDLILEQTDGNKVYADAVAEAIIRHQDLGESGYITSLGLIIQIATILDNVGLNSEYIHPDTLDLVNKKYSRDGWIGCFANAIDNENTRKPWGHTSALGVDKFRDDVLANSLRYEKL
ncbi:cyanamide hydratase Ddi3p [[Candida] anglica]|uniref:Cyanamide hydratase Ddi3p n=1 Tax=[Candida] anglica TaxID=148631 RepID=A0ABP0E9S2_9ASCO